MASEPPPSGLPDTRLNRVQTILIADDQYENRYFLESLLKGNGYLVITAENGQGVLEILKTEKVDAIISDIHMSEMDGFQLCRALKKDPEFAHIPFIFYTASYPEPEDRDFGLSLGADEYVSKPIDPVDFMAIIRRVLGSSEHKEGVLREEPPLDDLSYYATYADTIRRKLEKKGVESGQQRELARFNEEKYRILFETMAEGVTYQDKNGVIIDANSSAERILGLTRDQLLGRVSTDPQWRSIKEDFSDFPGEEHPGMVALHTGKKVTTIMGVYNPIDDLHHWILINSVPLFQPGEETPFQVFTTFEDITRVQEIRNTLYASEKQYRELVENISDTLFSVNSDGVITYISPSINLISGYQPSYYAGRQFLDFIFPDDREMIERWLENFLHNHSIPVVEFRVRTNNNEVRHLRVKVTPVRVNDQIVEVTGVLSDITLWKVSEILESERAKEIQALLSLHLLMQKTEEEIFEYALQAALEVTKSKVGYIAFIRKGGEQIDFQIWSPEVEKTCSIQDCSPHMFTSPQGLRFESITKKSTVIINDYPSSPGRHGYPEGHGPILRFLEVPILDGERVSAIIAVANRKERYTETHARSLNTLGNTLWEIISLKRSDKEIMAALNQISKNMEQMATLNDTIRNPLAVLAAISDLVDDPLQSTMLEAIRNIDSVIVKLDQGWVQSEKVKDFLIKHYQFKEEHFV